MKKTLFYITLGFPLSVALCVFLYYLFLMIVSTIDNIMLTAFCGILTLYLMSLFSYIFGLNIYNVMCKIYICLKFKD